LVEEEVSELEVAFQLPSLFSTSKLTEAHDPWKSMRALTLITAYAEWTVSAVVMVLAVTVTNNDPFDVRLPRTTAKLIPATLAEAAAVMVATSSVSDLYVEFP